MGQINLYKVDAVKLDQFIASLYDKFECIGSEKYSLEGDDNYEVSIHVSIPEDRNPLTWQWLLDLYDYGTVTTQSNPKAVIVIRRTNSIYVVTYGFAYFIVDKFSDRDFAFSFARRIKFKEIKTTTLTAPNSHRNKTVNTYVNYRDLEFDSGESFAKIKTKVEIPEGFEIHGESIEIGHSIKTNISEDSIERILIFVKYVEDVIKNNDINYNIPLFCEVTNQDLLEELEEELKLKITDNIDNINVSELDIIGATEIFNNNDSTFKLKYRHKELIVSELTKYELERFSKENNFNLKEKLLEIKVISMNDGRPVRTDIIKNMIDYTDDKNRCILSKGQWYQFNDDYESYLRDSIAEINTYYDPKYDFDLGKYNQYIESRYYAEKDDPKYIGISKKEIVSKFERKYYAERTFNNVMGEQWDFIVFDRVESSVGGARVELMDLYKDETMFAVKIGDSSGKLCYAVDQSVSSLKIYKHGLLEGMPEVKNVAVWLVLKRANKLNDINGQPDLNELNMIMLKNKLDSWKKEVRALGYNPIVYINYWN